MIREVIISFSAYAIFCLTQIKMLNFLSYLRHMQFSYIDISKFPDDFMSFNKIHYFYMPRHQDGQLSCHFYVF